MIKFGLITRPAEDALELQESLDSLGVFSYVEPLAEIEYLDKSVPSGFDLVVFTSAKAINAYRRVSDEAGVRIAVVGKISEKEAKKAGFFDIMTADGEVDSLIKLIRQEIPPKSKILYVHGNFVTKDLAGELGDEYSVTGLELYKTTYADRFTLDLVSAIKKGQVLFSMFYSSKVAECFIKLAKKNKIEADLKKIKAICISDKVAQNLGGFFGEALISGDKSTESMLELVESITKSG